MRVFRLTESGVRCSANGLFVGPVAMLSQRPRTESGGGWAVRPSDELDQELSAAYGLAIDVAGKRDGLAGVARALACGDLALAQIAALLLRFPDPPALAKDAPDAGVGDLAARLFESGLTKDWDPSKHPRTEEPPNRGWFAPTPDVHGSSPLATRRPEADPSDPRAIRTDAPAPEPLWREALRVGRTSLKGAAKEVMETGRFALWLAPELRLAIETAIDIVASSPLNSGEQRAIDQLRASLDPPKTLAELQTRPTQNVLGYDLHHIVEQNPANIVKTPIPVVTEKFGREVIDDPNNLVWVPRLKHELITAYYNSTEPGDTAGRLHRQVVNNMDYDSQVAAGLLALQMFGVLQ